MQLFYSYNPFNQALYLGYFVQKKAQMVPKEPIFRPFFPKNSRHDCYLKLRVDILEKNENRITIPTKGPIMKSIKKMNTLVLTIMGLNLSLGACEFTITNDTKYNKIYISLNPQLANVVSENTLKEPFTKSEDEEKPVTLNNLSISKKGKGKTPFTKQFDVYFPLKSNGQYERRYRVHMKYCKDKEFNSMTVSQIQNAHKDVPLSEKIDMKRFDVADYSIKDHADNAHTLLTPHAPDFEHQHEYEARKQGKTQLNEATEQEEEHPGYMLENPFVYKEILP
jgi:hypothetical protein